MPDYLKILQSLLADDEKLLKKETTAEMFRAQLNSEKQRALQESFNSSNRSRLHVGKFPENVHYEWGFSGLLTVEHVSINGLQ
jgi:hypothetical protein